MKERERKMEKYNIIELIKEIKERNKNNKIDISSFCDYSNCDYIDDVIHELADSNTDVYCSDLFDWLKDNYSYVDDAINEFGLPENPSIINQIQMGQYFQNNEEIYDNLDDMLSIYIYNILKENNIEELTEEQNDKIYNLVENMKDDGKFYSDDEIIKEIINNEEEQED